MKSIKIDEKVIVAFSILTSLMLYIAIFAQDTVYLDRMFLPDDAYYTLTIARNIANGCGASIDCIDKTSGFQPLDPLQNKNPCYTTTTSHTNNAQINHAIRNLTTLQQPNLQTLNRCG